MREAAEGGIRAASLELGFFLGGARSAVTRPPGETGRFAVVDGDLGGFELMSGRVEETVLARPAATWTSRLLSLVPNCRAKSMNLDFKSDTVVAASRSARLPARLTSIESVLTANGALVAGAGSCASEYWIASVHPVALGV